MFPHNTVSVFVNLKSQQRTDTNEQVLKFLEDVP